MVFLALGSSSEDCVCVWVKVTVGFVRFVKGFGVSKVFCFGPLDLTKVWCLSRVDREQRGFSEVPSGCEGDRVCV